MQARKLLDSVIEATAAQQMLDAQRRETLEQAARNAEKAAVVERFSTMLRREFDPDTYEALGFTVEATTPGGGSWKEKAIFIYGGNRWTVEAIEMTGAKAPHWEIGCYARALHKAANIGALGGALVALLAEDYALNLKAAAEQERQYAQNEQERAERLRQMEQAQAAHAAAEQVDIEIRRSIAARIAGEQHYGNWVWPDDVKLRYYRLRWCVGTAGTINDEPYPVFETGVALDDTPDDNGYWTVYPATYAASAPRLLKFSEGNKLTIEKQTARGLPDLPFSCDEGRTFVVEGVKLNYDYGEEYFVHDSAAQYTAQYTVDNPPDWLKKTLERLARK